ncbi:MAG TPA: WYL domain-containing protein [Candidatus Limnocylindrales bacterium]|nr:WYL domain-containing protein [Candidatus Limnocylindrales bacterium]
MTSKRDRLARLWRVVTLLQASGEAGIRPREIAQRVAMSVRSVYRDLAALETEIGIPLWNENGRWGVADRAFLPPLRLTLQEARAIFLAARLLARYADKYDPHLASAFEKLAEGLPTPLREHVEGTLEILAERSLDARFNRHVADLTRAWAERRVVTFRYAPARYTREAEERQAIVRPYLLEPSVQTHALYLIGHDEVRGALRTFKVERIQDLALTPRTFEAPPAATIQSALRRAWDIIADQPEREVVLRFAPSVAARVTEATWHPTQRVELEPDGSLRWSARVSGTVEIRLWILSWGADVEVLTPDDLRADVARTLEQAAARYRSAAG